MTYAEKFLALAAEWEMLELIDESIAAARTVMPSNGHLQLQLDRRQSAVNDQRAKLVTYVAVSAILN